MKFLWDEYKNIENQIKHGISFEDAKKVFSSDFRLKYDEDHSTIDEDRYIAVGRIPTHDLTHELIVVIFTEILDDVYRINSARKARKHEV